MIRLKSVYDAPAEQWWVSRLALLVERLESAHVTTRRWQRALQVVAATLAWLTEQVVVAVQPGLQEPKEFINVAWNKI